MLHETPIFTDYLTNSLSVTRSNFTIMNKIYYKKYCTKYFTDFFYFNSIILLLYKFNMENMIFFFICYFWPTPSKMTEIIKKKICKIAHRIFPESSNWTINPFLFANNRSSYAEEDILDVNEKKKNGIFFLNLKIDIKKNIERMTCTIHSTSNRICIYMCQRKYD